MASQFTFRDLSLTSNSALPKRWQSELMHQLTRCRNATRTRVAQKNALRAPCQDQAQSPPISAGASSESATRAGKRAEIRAIFLSASRSGQNFSFEVRLPSKSQPMC